MTGQVLQDDCQVDDVVAHHVLILGWEDLLVDDLDWKDSERKKKEIQTTISKKCESEDEGGGGG